MYLVFIDLNERALLHPLKCIVVGKLAKGSEKNYEGIYACVRVLKKVPHRVRFEAVMSDITMVI